MKPLFAIPIILAAFTPQVRSQNAAAVPMRDAATHEQLAEQWRKAQQQNPIQKLQPAQGEDPAKVNQPKDLVSQSDVLCFGGMATLVPKKAVLNIPANLAERLKFQPGTRIQSWAEFFAQNRGWITTVEVSRAQAEGNLPLPEDVVKRYKEGANVVVATYQGGPISVLPPKDPPPENTPVTANSTRKPKP